MYVYYHGIMTVFFFPFICRYPKVIVLDDVRGALLNREEFDIFTNHGLASKHRLTAAD